jgi:hypothetical protein
MLKMFLLTRILKGKQERENRHLPKKVVYKILRAVKLKGKCVPLARMVMRNSKNIVARGASWDIRCMPFRRNMSSL